MKWILEQRRIKDYSSSALLTLAIVAALTGALRASEFRISDIPLQYIKGWGVTPAPLDWNGTVVLRGASEQHIRLLYRDLGITIVRIPVGGINVYNEGTHKTRSVVSLIEKQIKIATEAKLQYVITLLSAPSYFKAYYSNSSHVLMEPNRLRTECEELFASYIADILDQLRQEKLPTPVGFSIQAQPDNPTPDFGIPFTVAHGAPYSAVQWQHVFYRVRAELDGRGRGDVKLIGPETFGPVGWNGWATDEAFKLIEKDDEALSGWTYNSDGAFSSEPPSASAAIRILHRMRERNAVWMLASNCNRAVNDRDLLIDVFLSMRRDFVDIGASYWFWRYAFDWNPSSEVLVWGRAGDRTPVYEALKLLWHTAPPGAQVRALVRNSVANDDFLDGFALTTKTKTVCVCVNPSSEPATAIIMNLAGKVKATSFTPTPTDIHLSQSSSMQYGIAIPPRSVIILVADKPFR